VVDDSIMLSFRHNNREFGIVTSDWGDQSSAEFSSVQLELWVEGLNLSTTCRLHELLRKSDDECSHTPVWDDLEGIGLTAARDAARNAGIIENELANKDHECSLQLLPLPMLD
jgi:hypothetical protein